MKVYLAYLSIGIVVIGASCARADDSEEPHHFLHLWHQKKYGTPPPGKPRAIPHTDERAGYPRELAGHLEQTNTAGGIGYYVGGGVKWGHGEGRTVQDGTWGWDETGHSLFRRRVILGWSGGRKYQGGTGAYRTDGPVVPDLIYTVTATMNQFGRDSEEPE
jgi:hypothetical protein